MNPGHGAPKLAAPAACSRARSVPNPKAASGVAGPGGIIEMTSASGPTASTSGTGTAAASASQRRPFASAANAAATSPVELAGTGPASWPGAATALAKARRPPDSVSMRCW